MPIHGANLILLRYRAGDLGSGESVMRNLLIAGTAAAALVAASALPAAADGYGPRHVRHHTVGHHTVRHHRVVHRRVVEDVVVRPRVVVVDDYPVYEPVYAYGGPYFRASFGPRFGFGPPFGFGPRFGFHRGRW